MKLFLTLLSIFLSMSVSRKHGSKKQIITYQAGLPVPVTTIYQRPERLDVRYPAYSVSHTYTPNVQTHIVANSNLVGNLVVANTGYNTVILNKRRKLRKF